MKRFILPVAALLLLLSSMATVTFAKGNTAVYVLSQQETSFSMSKEEGDLTFWEAPDVITGQTRDNGTITLKNDTDRTVDFTLASVSLPYDNAAALAYLDAVTITLKEGDRVLYCNSITRLMDSDRDAVQFLNVPPWESRQLEVSISCAFTYTGQLPSYSSLLWEFRPNLHEKVPTTTAEPMEAPTTFNWKLLAETAGIVVLVTGIAGVCVWLVRRRNS